MLLSGSVQIAKKATGAIRGAMRRTQKQAIVATQFANDRPS